MFVDNDVIVLGISGDSVSNQQLFKKANHLNFTLLADIKGDTAKKFGVSLRKGGSIPKTIGGEEFILVRGVTPARWTFIIGKNGKLAYKNTSVKAGQDSKDVLETLKALKAKSG